MSDLPEFLLARIAEDEAAARTEWDWMIERHGSDFWTTGEGAPFNDEWRYETDRDASLHVSPRRVLAECEAKRRIVEHHARVEWDDGELGCAVCGVDILPPVDGVQVRESAGWPCPTMGWLALPYTDHADYRQEWKP